MEKRVKVYSKQYCPFCIRVLNYLEEKNIDYELVEVSHDEETYRAIKKETGHNTVPIIFVDGKFVGGSDDFFSNLSELGL